MACRCGAPAAPLECPAASSATWLRSTLPSLTGSPSMEVITSPRFRPPFSPGPPGCTPLTSAPVTCSMSRLRASSDVIGCTVTPEQAAMDAPLVDQLRHHVARHVRRNREPDPDVAARRRQDLRVDADQLAARAHQRAAGVALVDRCIRLDEVLERTVAHSGGAALRADDAHRDRLADAERVAERQDDVADLHLVRVARATGSAGSRRRSSARRDRSARPSR